ncbi:MAG: hypothetical protein IMZ61_11070 [Planctomycetes bacterium]|nr:hypothetical protein [Planctomycetota bacterium]
MGEYERLKKHKDEIVKKQRDESVMPADMPAEERGDRLERMVDTMAGTIVEKDKTIFDLRTALDKIKIIVCGDARPDNNFQNTETRLQIADICDAVLYPEET